MNAPQQVALDRALTLIKAAGVPFAVLLPDGTKLGELEIKPPRQAPRRKTGRTVKYHWDKDLGHVAQVKAMACGDVLEWVVAEGGENLRSAVGGAGVRAFGKGSCIATMTKLPDGRQKIELLRVS